MACYGDLVSLGETIARLLQSSKLNWYYTKRLTVAHEEAQSVQRLLQKLDVGCGLLDDKIHERNSFSGQSSRPIIRSIGQRMNTLDGKMREVARELEDALETHHLLNHDDRLQQEKLKQDVDSFSRKVMELEEEYAKAEEVGEAEEDDEEDRIDDDLASGKKKMVGYSDVMRQLESLLPCSSSIVVLVLVGMAGLGKTTLARRLFDHPEVPDLYDYRVWVTVGPKKQLTDILESIINQVNPGKKITKGYGLDSQLKASVKDRRCLIVLDDVWSKEIIVPLEKLLSQANTCIVSRYGFIKSFFTILVTSRLDKLGAGPRIKIIKLRFMNKDESWDLLRDKVFGEEKSCSPELVKAGKRIAENCEGLPLTIVTIADILSKADETTMTPEYWNQVAERRNSVFVDAYRRMSKVLLRSYEFLPRYLKEYFLYMGVFPPKYDIPLSKLALLMGVEGCFIGEASKDLQGHVSTHIEELIGKSLVLVRKTTFKNKPKTYGLHSALWHSCVGEASKNKFSHVFNKYADSLNADRMRNQRRLCVHNNVLFNIEYVRNSMASISTARSLLCTGPHHRYPVPVCFDHLRLLRVIDALTVRFYEFPTQVAELVRLRYLALTCDGKLPTSISKLSSLEILIVGRYLNIVKLHEKAESSSNLPMEIWDMKELQHLQVMGEDLPEPRAGVVLPNLVTLVDANARSCTKGVLKGLPKLKKLGVRIELCADDAEPLRICYNNDNNNLESIKCVVVNPAFGWSPIVSSLLFPYSLKKLSLNGLGCPWEDINEAVASLPNLEVLKLRCYAFRGAKWEIPEKGFRSLEFLLIEDTDLVHWALGNESFSRLHYIVLKECYKLQDIQPECPFSLKRIEIVDCNPSAVACVQMLRMRQREQIEQMEEMREIPYNIYSTFEVVVVSSWDDDGKNLKS